MKAGQRVKKILKFFSHFSTEYMKMNALQSMENEYSQLLNVFLLLLFGNLVGLPSPPSSITLRILPLELEEVRYLIVRSGRSGDALGDLVDAFNVEI
ncbi:MAG: hypothetical protein ACPL0A_03050 [Candidatus Micrarchaeia archaeon]|jgi:hypothetical protein